MVFIWKARDMHAICSRYSTKVSVQVNNANTATVVDSYFQEMGLMVSKKEKNKKRSLLSHKVHMVLQYVPSAAQVERHSEFTLNV